MFSIYSKPSRTHSYENIVPTLDHTIRKNTRKFCFPTTPYFSATYFSVSEFPNTPLQCTVNNSNFSPFSSHSQICNSNDYPYRPENFFIGIEASTIYQLGPKPTKLQQCLIWKIRKIIFFATYFHGPASSSLFSLLETHSKDWSIYSTKFLKQFDSATIKTKIKLKTKMFNCELMNHFQIMLAVLKI